MEFFRRYLRQHRLAILLFILSWGLLAAGFALYGLPLAAVAYPALLSLLLCLATAVWDYTRTLRRHRKLSELQTAANAQLMDLPDPASIGEADCMPPSPPCAAPHRSGRRPMPPVIGRWWTTTPPGSIRSRPPSPPCA